MSTQNKSKVIRTVVLVSVLAVVGYFVFKKVSFIMNNEDTENSQLEANIVPVLPKVGGWVTAVNIKDNQQVKAGDTLVTIDDRDLKIRVLQAEVALKNAEANVSLIAANAGTAGANVNTRGISIVLSEGTFNVGGPRTLGRL